MRPRKRILFFAPQFAEISTRLAEALSAEADVLFILDGTQRRAQCDPEWFRSATARVSVVEFRADRRFWRMLWTPLVILAGLMFRPDVLHLQEQADQITSRVARFFGAHIPVVVTVHDPEPHMGSDARFLYGGAQQYRDQIRAAADLLHVQSAFCYRQMRALGVSKPIVQTRHGLMHVPGNAQVGRPEHGRVLFFGRMEAYKGLEVLVEAMEDLAGRGRDYRLVLAGRGEELDRIGDRARRLPNVEILDHFLTCYEVVEQFQRASVVVLPYLEASQSGVAAAAIANGRPIVASATGGLAEIVTPRINGLLVEPGDAAALAEAVDELLSDAALYDDVAAGVRQSQRHLSWEGVADTLCAAYDSLLGHRQAGGQTLKAQIHEDGSR